MQRTGTVVLSGIFNTLRLLHFGHRLIIYFRAIYLKLSFTQPSKAISALELFVSMLFIAASQCKLIILEHSGHCNGSITKAVRVRSQSLIFLFMVIERSIRFYACPADLSVYAQVSVYDIPIIFAG